MFKEHYDLLYKQYIESAQTNGGFQGQIQQVSHQNPQFLPIPNQERGLEHKKSTSLMQIKKEPSETLSSDSNSRSKKEG